MSETRMDGAKIFYEATLGVLDRRAKQFEEEKSNTHNRARQVLLGALARVGNSASSDSDKLIPKALNGTFVKEVLTFDANPPSDYSKSFGDGIIPHSLKVAADTLSAWHEGRKHRRFGKGSQGDLKDRAAWTMYETLRALSLNTALHESKEALSILDAISYTADMWSQITSEVGTVGFWRSHFRDGTDSLNVPLMSMRKNLRDAKKYIALAATQKSAAEYIKNLKNQQDSVSRELVYTMIKGLSDNKIKPEDPNQTINEILSSENLYCTFLHALGCRIFQGPLTAEEKELMNEPSKENAKKRKLLTFIAALEKPDAATPPGEDPTLTFIRNLEKVSFANEMANYSNGTNYSLVSGIAASLHANNNKMLLPAFKEFCILAKHMVALNETIKLQEKIIELGKRYGDVWMYGGAWKTLSALLSLTPIVLAAIEKSVDALLVIGNRARAQWKRNNAEILQRNDNLAHVSHNLLNLAIAKTKCAQFVVDLQQGLARFYDETKPETPDEKAINQAASETAELFNRVQRLGHLYESMGVKSNITTLLQPPQAEVKPSSPPQSTPETKSVPPQVVITPAQKARSILMEGVFGSLVANQKSSERIDESESLSKWLRGKKGSLFACKNIWRTSTGELRKGGEKAAIKFLTDRKKITRTKDGLFFLRYSRDDIPKLRQAGNPKNMVRTRLGSNYKTVTDIDAQAALLLLGAFYNTFTNKKSEEARFQAWYEAISNIVPSLSLELLERIKPDADKMIDAFKFDPIPWEGNALYAAKYSAAADDSPAQDVSPTTVNIESEMGILRAEMKAEWEADMKSYREEVAARLRPHVAQSEVTRQASFTARLFSGSRVQPSGATPSIHPSPLSASHPAATSASNPSPAPSNRKVG